MLAASVLALAPALALFLGAIVLTQTQAIIASIVVVLVVLIAWKFLKLAFRIALVIAAAVVIFLALRWANVL